MQIVLLGATGFVGHRLLPELSAAGHRCTVLSRYALACRELTIIPGVEVRQADIYDDEQLKMHFAGADAVVEKIISACRASGVRRLVQVSALNAGKGSSHYLVSKGQAEEVIRAADDLDSTIVQPSVIFGDGDSFFNRFASLLKMAPVLPLACPEAKMQPVWVGDVATAMTRALEDPETFGQTLIMVGPEAFSLRELVEFTATAVGLKRKIIGLPDSLSRLQGRLLDFVPGKPFSSDNYQSLQVDNTSDENSLWRFGIKPRSLASVVPGYLVGSQRQYHLDEYRKRAGR